MRKLFLLALLCNAPMLLAADASLFAHNERNRDAFSRPAPGLSAAELRVFNFGNRIFNTNWVVAPASAAGFDGLGPTFNRVSCSGCHLRDGRGRPPQGEERELLSMLVRISIPGAGAHGEPKDVPGYGAQLNDRAIPSVAPEAGVLISWQEVVGAYADGESYALRRPKLTFTNPAYGALPANLQTSARVAPAVFGLGLLEAIPEANLRQRADPDDQDKDGISGRVNEAYSASQQRTMFGRFGWKANTPTLLDQNAAAAQGDLGLTSRVFPEENCPPQQLDCGKALTGGKPELADAFLDKLTLYTQMLGVPSARPLNTPSALRGQQLFSELGCAACHTPEQRTGQNVAVPLLAEQTFMPYSDLLLHDMGPGLADGRADFAASASEWRTTPLWGIGLVPTTNDHAFYVHDGRARGLSEAILWHGGEAEAAQQRFKHASKTERAALLEFLNTL